MSRHLILLVTVTATLAFAADRKAAPETNPAPKRLSRPTVPMTQWRNCESEGSEVTGWALNCADLAVEVKLLDGKPTPAMVNVKLDEVLGWVGTTKSKREPKTFLLGKQSVVGVRMAILGGPKTVAVFGVLLPLGEDKTRCLMCITNASAAAEKTCEEIFAAMAAPNAVREFEVAKATMAK